MTRRTAIGGLTVLGLVVAGWGVIDAHPLVFAYTEAEYAEARTGRMLMVAGTAALAGAAVLLAGDGASRWRALAVVAPGLVCTGLALAVPPSRGGLALVLFLPLAGGALAGAFAGRREVQAARPSDVGAPMRHGVILAVFMVGTGPSVGDREVARWFVSAGKASVTARA